MPALLDEVEAIVNSGTKLNLDYYINEIMDEDHQDEVFEYFREAAFTVISQVDPNQPCVIPVTTGALYEFGIVQLVQSSNKSGMINVQHPAKNLNA